VRESPVAPRPHFEAGADAMLKAVCEEIGKAVLAEDEMEHAVLDTFWAEGQDQSDDRRYDKAIAQAQLDKILALLQKTSMSSQKEGQ